MTTNVHVDVARRPAAVLNDACQCIWLDRVKLRQALEQHLGEAGSLMEARPGLVSGSVVFVDPQQAAAMDRTMALVHRALSSPAYTRRVGEYAPPIARLPKASPGGVLGFDFHLGETDPQLIEINTNPGGLLVNLVLAQTLTACCEPVARPLPMLAAGSVPLADLPDRVAGSFREEWASERGGAPLDSIAIVDDDPIGQYLYPEFLLYRRLFERNGWRAQVVDAGEPRDPGRRPGRGRRADRPRLQPRHRLLPGGRPTLGPAAGVRGTAWP